MKTPDLGQHPLVLAAPVRRDLVVSLARLVAVGLVAVGVSGLLAGGMGLAFGKRFVTGDVPGVTYTKARCADYFEYTPHAGTCEEAATSHHFDEVVTYRVAAGLAGLFGFGALVLLRRRLRTARGASLPEGFEATIGTSVFGLAAVALLGQSLGQLAVLETAGAGQYLTRGWCRWSWPAASG